MNKAAQALGRLAKGVSKTLTDEQRKFRAEQLATARKKRHEKTEARRPACKEDGLIIGKVGYNGRVWADERWTPNTKEICDD